MLSLAACTFVLSSATWAAPIYYFTRLSGANEFPANGSTGTGTAEVIADSATHTMRVVVTFSGLSANNTAAHIHCCVATPFDITLTAGVATPTPTFPGFPAGTSGVYDQTFDTTLASSFRGGFVTSPGGGTAAGAEAALFAGLSAGTAYLNIHTSTFPGGELRGFLQQAPEPGTYALVGSALAGLLFVRRRR